MSLEGNFDNVPGGGNDLPTYGARPLKRVVQKQLVDKLALKILEGEFNEGDSVLIDAADGELAFLKQ